MSEESTEPAKEPPSSHAPPADTPSSVARLALGAVGVVYGDIGTSPLYAIKECFNPPHGVETLRVNVLGVLSLVFWSLTLVIVVKYISFIMRADNRGEGGTLALASQVVPPGGSIEKQPRGRLVLLMLALFGTSLLYGEGLITPAISVLSAIEGLEVATPVFQPVVVPLTVVILIALFWVQKRGTAGIGAVFGPVTLLWFVSIAAAGLPWIIRHPEVIGALNPYHAISFFAHHGVHGFLLMGSVVLCITGGEALYADMGHFGKRPIRVAWYAVVMPALLINYFGQGALLLSRSGQSVANPFYALVSGPFMYPMVVVATLATVVASQAMISGAFSLTRQAIQLGYSPRLTIVHTSEEAQGQIYIPEVNRFLMVSCIALVLAFRGSSPLAAAYGIAVTGTMTITSLLFYAVARKSWGWGRLRAGALLFLFLTVDLTFLSSCVVKIAHGGWIPIVVAAAVFSAMTTWKAGRAAMARFVTEASIPIAEFVRDVGKNPPHRVRGTAVFMTANLGGTPTVLLHNLKHNKILHEQVVLLAVVTEQVPQVPPAERVQVEDLGEGFYQVTAHYGFMQTPNVPEIMRLCRVAGLKSVVAETSYFLGRETLLTTGRSKMARWRKALFSFLSRNARPATAFFGIPPNRVVELGAQIEL